MENMAPFSTPRPFLKASAASSQGEPKRKREREKERERERNGSGHIHHLSSCKLFDADHDIVLSIKCKTKPSKKRCINKIDYDFMFIVFVIEKRRKRGGSGGDGAGNSTRFPETL